MKSFNIVALSSLLAIATAAPVEKRDIVWYTVTQEVIDTVSVFTTVWLPAGGAAPSATSTVSTTITSAADVNHQPVASPQTPMLTLSTSVTSVSSVPAPSSSSPSSSAAAISPVDPAPVVPSTTTSSIAPVVTSEALAVASTPAPSPVVTPSPPPTVAGAVAAATILPGAKVSNGCTPGEPCIGDITHYNPSDGVGACGGPVHADTEMVVAISVGMMGSLSNGLVLNPLCGRTVHLTDPATGTHQTATVVDKCAGCINEKDVDLSPTLFEYFYPLGHGRQSGIEWYWV